ncbi:MAG: hypothetical protein V4727_03720 [Verrucomicrobiota bacterium]
MSTHAPHPDYPLDITSDEARLGFSVCLIGALDDYEPSRWTPVVCKVLSSSDIVVKTTSLFGDGVMYSHRRFGHMNMPYSIESVGPASWSPVGNPYATCEQAVFEAETGASQEDGPIVECQNAPIKEA